MKKQLVTLGLLFTALSLGAQMKNIDSDTIKIQIIEDVNLHKTGNPNKAKPFDKIKPDGYGNSAANSHRYP